VSSQIIPHAKKNQFATIMPVFARALIFL